MARLGDRDFLVVASRESTRSECAREPNDVHEDVPEHGQRHGWSFVLFREVLSKWGVALRAGESPHEEESRQVEPHLEQEVEPNLEQEVEPHLAQEVEPDH